MRICVRYLQKWIVSRRRSLAVSMFIPLILGGIWSVALTSPAGVAFAADQVTSLLNDIDRTAKTLEYAVNETASDFSAADQLTHEYRMAQSRYKLYECVLLAIFALVSLGTVLVFLNKKPTCSATHMVNASGLVFVVFGTLFLVLLADVDEQLNAGIGIMGAVAGYLFGTMRRQEGDELPSRTKAPLE